LRCWELTMLKKQTVVGVGATFIGSLHVCNENNARWQHSPHTGYE
jgi:hypothetical protein